jgi:hypothetical protein
MVEDENLNEFSEENFLLSHSYRFLKGRRLVVESHNLEFCYLLTHDIWTFVQCLFCKKYISFIYFSPRRRRVAQI